MLKGDVYFTEIGTEGRGSEQRGDRYAVIVQNNIGNLHSPTVIVAFITSSVNKACLPTHVEINRRNSGISVPSIILCEQIRTLDKSRLGEKVGHLSETKKMELDSALIASLGIKVGMQNNIAV